MNKKHVTHLLQLSLCVFILLSLGCAAKPAQDSMTSMNNLEKKEVIFQEQHKPVLIPVAESMIGTPYKFGGTSTTGFDCSGFVQWAYSHAGVKLPRRAVEQSRTGKLIKDKKAMEVGDIVAFRHPRRGYHTGIYLGDDKFIHSPRRNTSIRVSSLSESYFSKSFLGARRVLELKASEEDAAEKLLAAYAVKQEKIVKAKAATKAKKATAKKSTKKAVKKKTSNKKTAVKKTTPKKQVASRSS